MSSSKLLQSNVDLQYPLVDPTLNLNFTRKSLGIDPAYTFTRNSSGTYIDADGYIKTAGVNQPRFDHDPLTGECKGLSVEESRVNYHKYSKNFTNWIPNRFESGASVSTLTSTTETLDPSGGTGAYVLYGHMEITMTGPGSGTSFPFRGSVFVKRHPLGRNTFILYLTSGGGDSQITINFDTETFFASGQTPQNPSIEKFPNGWYRIGLTITPNTTSWRPTIGAIISGSSIENAYWYVYGVQVEKGLFNTSYIPTTNTTVTRQPDQLVLNNAPISNQGTFFIESNPTTGVPLVADNGTSSLTINSPLNQYTKSVLYYNTNRTLRMSSDDSLPGDYIYTNPQDLNRVSLGFDSLNNSSYINGYLKKFSYYSISLSEDNLRALTGNKVSTYRLSDELIVTSGLVLNLDAGNPSSYPGTGTTWTDLSGLGYNFNLINGPTFNANNLGGIEQDGINDYIERTYTTDLAFNGNVSFTIQIVAKTKTLKHNADYPAIMSCGAGDSGGGWFVDFFDDNNVFGGPFGKIEFTRVQTGGSYINAGGGCGYYFTSLSDANSMNFWCYTYSSTSGGSLYRNGSLITSTATTGSITRSTTPNVSIGRRTLNSSRVTSCIFHSVSAYNRALTAQEIQQNFNALRGRFGI